MNNVLAEVVVVHVELKHPIMWGEKALYHIELVARREAALDCDGAVLQVELMRSNNGCEYQYFPMAGGNVITWSDRRVFVMDNESQYGGYRQRFYKYVAAGNIGWLETEDQSFDKQRWIARDGVICEPPA